MTLTRRPPRLLVKTLGVIFATVAVLLVVVFVVVTVGIRDQVRRAAIANLDTSHRLFATVEARRQLELRAQVMTLADSPTLKAALDTYIAEARTSDAGSRRQLIRTISKEIEKVAQRVESDAIVLADERHTTLTAVGRLANRWPPGHPVGLLHDDPGNAFDGIARVRGEVFRVIAVPLLLVDVRIGTLYVATIVDERYADELASLTHTPTAIVSQGRVLASTLSSDAARQFEGSVAASHPPGGMLPLSGESYTFRRLVEIGDVGFYALESIDVSSREPMNAAMRNLALIAGGAALLALIASFWVARMLSEPIGRLSASLAHMAAAHDVTARLPLTGSSLELDTLTDTFNALMASVADAESQTEAAYTGAIRALAAALDARDPYTAGHSERVSVLSVAIGRTLGLPSEELEVLRLGALLHDIGKIGIPDRVLRKPSGLTTAELAVIKEHPVLGARILRSVPFLSRHLPIVELHHERPDGRGYPFGLRGDDIPLAARIVHVADAYDAITSARAYRMGRSSGDALHELWRCAGTEFHAEIVGALAAALPSITPTGAESLVEAISA